MNEQNQQETPSDFETLTFKEAASVAGLNVKVIREAVRNGDLPTFRYGSMRAAKIVRRTLLEFINDQSTNAEYVIDAASADPLTVDRATSLEMALPVPRTRASHTGGSSFA